MPDSALLQTTRRFGLPDVRRHVPLIVALAVDAVGSGISEPLLLLYLTRVIGLPLGPAGVLMTATAVGSLVVPAVVGRLTRRVGARAIVVTAQLIQGAAMLGLLAFREVPLIAVATALAAVGQRAFWSSVFALVATAADQAEHLGGEDESGRWFAASGMIQNAGFAIGGLIAGALLVLGGATPFLIALAINAGSFLLSALLFRFDRSAPTADQPAPSEPGHRRAPVWTDRRYLALILANTLYAFCSVLLGVGLPVYAIGVLHAPAWLIGPLLAINTVLGATCQGLGVRATRRLNRRTVLVIAGLIWIVWGLASAGLTLLQASWLIAGLFGCVLLFAVAELLHAPTSMTLAAAEAPTADRESYLSWFQYSFAIASIATPAAFGALTEQAAPLPWLAAAAAAAAAILLTTTATRQSSGNS